MLLSVGNAVAAHHAKGGGRRVKAGYSKRVLVMDDQESVRCIACAMLQALRYACQDVPDGQSAVHEYERALRSGARYDAILMDLSVPNGMGGEEAMRRILQIDPEAVGIVCSGRRNPGAGWHLERGFAGSVEKPYRLADLAASLSKALTGKTSSLQTENT